MTLILDFEETYLYSAIHEQIGIKNEELACEFAQSVTDHLLSKLS